MRHLVGALCLSLVCAACGSGGDGTGHAHNDGHAQVSPFPAGFGEPADASEADRRIEVVADDTNRFDPDELQVAVGETVTFVVENDSSAEHEFVLGDEAYHAGVSEDHAHGANGVHLPPGDEGELTFTFHQAGSIRYACHVANHYEIGMFGSITVE